MVKSCQTCKHFDTATCMVCDTLLDDRWELCTKGQYCDRKRIHTCNPNFNPKDLLDDDFKETVDALTGSFEEIFNDCLEDTETESDI